MNVRATARATLALLALALLDGCATTETTASRAQPTASNDRSQATRTRRRRRSRRLPAPPPPSEALNGTAAATPPASNGTGNGTGIGTGNAPGLAVPPSVPRVGEAPESREAPQRAFGSPVVAAPRAPELTPRWARVGRRQVLACDGSAAPRVVSPQSPMEPTTAAVVRGFQPVESQVLGCAPPVNQNGRFAVRGLFLGSGAPQEFSFPSGGVTEAAALCVGRALCAIRLPAFRSINASVVYEYVAALPAEDEGE